MVGSVEVLIHSHLSDSLIEMSWNQEMAEQRIKFVKYLTSRFADDLKKWVNAEEVYEEFLEWSNK